MPITSLQLRNFKCFADSGRIPLAPLTVVFGKNNVGKSTILQGLMTLKQTLDAAEYEARLNIRGPLFSGGSYSDVVHAHKTSLKMSLELGITDSRGTESTVRMEYSSDEPSPPRLATFTLHSAKHPVVEIRRGKGAGGPYELHIGGERLGSEKQANFSFPLHGLLPLIGEEPSRVGRPSASRKAARSRARTALDYVEQSLGSMRALGAFRHAPQRRYEYAGYARDNVDAAGRYVVDALIDDVTRRGRGRGNLFREVNAWLHRVGHVSLLPIASISPTARVYELRLRSLHSGRWTNFADLGSGIGQAFPVIVEGLRTPIGSMFLVQEPEIHLHPDAQLAMADFLVALANSGRRVVVETHSEAILLRVRRKLAEAKRGDLRSEDVSLLVVEQGTVGKSKIRPLALDELGQIDGWPQGFLEDATRERFALMQAMVKA
jgi:hypothetical protein